MGADNAVVARRYLSEIWTKGNVSAIDELVDDEIEVRDTMGTDIRGKDQLREMVETMKLSFSDNTFTIEEIIVAGDRAVVRSVWTGTHRGDFFGIPGTGRTLTCQAIDVLRIENGLVVEDFGYADVYAMFEQLGVLPPKEKLATMKPIKPTKPSGREAPSKR